MFSSSSRIDSYKKKSANIYNPYLPNMLSRIHPFLGNKSSFDIKALDHDLEPIPLPSLMSRPDPTTDLNPLSSSSQAGASIGHTVDAIDRALAILENPNDLLEDLDVSDWQDDAEFQPNAVFSQPIVTPCVNKLGTFNTIVSSDVIPSSLLSSSRTEAHVDTPAFITATQSDQWNKRFQDLCTFRQEYGHCCVPSHWPQNHPLSQWVKRQRYQYKLRIAGRHSTMTDDRKAILEEMGFVWESHAAFWEERLNELHAYRDQHGHANVPSNYPENPQLAVWAKCQRRQFKLFCSEESKHKSNMKLERISKLARVGFVFNPRAASKQGWAPKKA